MATPLQVLILGDNQTDAELMLSELGRASYVLDWQRVETESEYLSAYAATIRDISERKQAEMVLRQSEERYRRFIDVTLEGFGEIGLDGRIHSVNPHLEKMFGYAHGEMIGLHIVQDLLYPDDRAAMIEQLQRHQQDESLPYEQRFRRKDGEILWTIVSPSPLKDNAGTIVGSFAMMTDITERKRAEEALANQHNLLYTLIDNLPDAVYVKDTAARKVLVNRADLRFIGKSKEQVLGKTDWDFFPAETASRLYADDQAVLQSGQTMINCERLLVNDSGHARWLRTSKLPLRDSQGYITGLVGIDHDITERVQAEAASAAAEAQLRALFASMQDMVLVIDREGVHREIAPTDTSFLYQSPEELLGKNLGDVFPAEQAEFFIETIRQVLESGQTTHIEYQLQIGERQVWFTAAISPMDEERTLWVAHDITQHKQAQTEQKDLLQQVQAQARQMIQVMQSVPQGVLLLDAGGRVLLANPMAARDLALLTQTGAGETLTHLGERPLAELLTSPPKGLWHEVQVGARTYEIIARPITNGSDQEQWVLLINDVTQARQTQRQLQQQERLASVGQMAAGMAHDFNNVMGIIVLSAGMLARSPGLSERDRNRLTTITEQAQHATALIRQVLDFSRRSVLERLPMDLLPQVKEQVKLLERTLPESIVVQLDYGRGAYTVYGDPTRMQQMVMNLAINAGHAMPHGGSLRIGLERITVAQGAAPLPQMAAGEWVQLTVTDSGTGIPPQVLPYIFDPFYTTGPSGEGTGLGLSQVHGIVGQHEGYIDVQTQVGVGTTFTVYLPALAVQTPELPDRELADLPQGQGKVLLVVEDNAELRRVLVEMLEVLDYSVLHAANGKEALDVLAASGNAVALVLSDVVMPQMGGIALFHALKERGWTKPVILLTGHPLEDEMETLREQGLWAWLLKPTDMEQVGRAIADALRTPLSV